MSVFVACSLFMGASTGYSVGKRYGSGKEDKSLFGAYQYFVL